MLCTALFSTAICGFAVFFSKTKAASYPQLLLYVSVISALIIVAVVGSFLGDINIMRMAFS